MPTSSAAPTEHPKPLKETEAGNYFVSNYPPYSFWKPEFVPEVARVLDSAPRPEIPLGVYFHIPFCRKRCHFCYFRVYTDKRADEVKRYLRAGKWLKKNYPLSKATLRDRTVGMVGMGRIGQAIARRLEAMQVPVVYHSRRPAAGVSYRHYPNLIDMARDVDVLLVITPGGAQTRHLINAAVLEALGPDGILINVARGSVVDEAALIKALQDKTILSAGLDVYAREPEVPAELIAMEHVVLFPHLGSASVATRANMDRLVVDNLLAWDAGKPPLTPVPETPWPPKSRG